MGLSDSIAPLSYVVYPTLKQAKLSLGAAVKDRSLEVGRSGRCWNRGTPISEMRFAERLAAMGKPVWARFTLVPGLTDDPANVEGIARFVAPMKNVEWVEVRPLHQLGAFKWKAMELAYKHADTPAPSPELVRRVIAQFHAAGCHVR
jgi:pyruvate-formate lyase-activating enzyme